MKQKIVSYKDLIVWQKGIELAHLIYKLTESFPSSEKYNLTSQMRRSAISIPSNIAEGKGRGTRKEYRRFLITVNASGTELETQMAIIKKIGYSNNEYYNQAEAILDEIMRILNTMISKLKV